MTPSQPPHDPPRDVADTDPAAPLDILADLARAKVAFQMRTIIAVLDTPRAAR